MFIHFTFLFVICHLYIILYPLYKGLGSAGIPAVKRPPQENNESRRLFAHTQGAAQNTFLIYIFD